MFRWVIFLLVTGLLLAAVGCGRDGCEGAKGRNSQYDRPKSAEKEG
jgi:hypothetical protein